MTGTAKTEEKEFVEIYGLHVVEIPTNVRCSAPTRTTTSSRRRARSSMQSSRTSSSGTKRASRCWWARSQSRRRAPRRAPHAARHHAQRPQRQGARARGGHHRSGRPQARRHDRDEHGRPRRRHRSRRNPQHEVRKQLHAEGLEDGEALSASYAAGSRRPGAMEERPRGDQGAGRPLRARHRAARGAPHRQPAAGPLRPSGRPGCVAVLPLCAGRPRAPLRRRPDPLIMERFKLPDDQPMESGLLSKQIENAQKKVENQNFVARKNVLKYDDVMNVTAAGHLRAAPPRARGDDLSRTRSASGSRTSSPTTWPIHRHRSARGLDLEGLVADAGHLRQHQRRGCARRSSPRVTLIED